MNYFINSRQGKIASLSHIQLNVLLKICHPLSLFIAFIVYCYTVIKRKVVSYSCTAYFKTIFLIGATCEAESLLL